MEPIIQQRTIHTAIVLGTQARKARSDHSVLETVDFSLSLGLHPAFNPTHTNSRTSPPLAQSPVPLALGASMQGTPAPLTS